MNATMLAALPDPEEQRAADPEFHIIEITPDLAQVWLGLNTSNRQLKPHQITAYAQDMKAGRWHLNGDAIRFSGSSRHPEKLLDGQNRLHAVMKAKVTVRMIVLFGIAEDAQHTMDSGAKRSVADNLRIQGRQNNVIIAAAAAVALHVFAGRIAGGARFTNATIQAFIDGHPELDESARVAMKYARRTDVPPAMVAYTHWVLSRLNETDATRFWRDASEKIGLEPGDPVIALTNRFAEARRNRTPLTRAAQLSLIFRAWNYRRAGKPLYQMKINSPKGGLIEIPEPK